MFPIQEKDTRKVNRCIAEVVTISVMALMGILIIYNASKLEYINKFGPGSGFFPLWIGILMLVCCAVIACNTYRDFYKGRAKQNRGTEKLFKATTLPRVGIMAGLSVLAGLLFTTAGAIPVISVYIFVVLRILGRHKLIKSLLIAVCFTIATYILFEKCVNVPLPHGLLWFLE